MPTDRPGPASNRLIHEKSPYLLQHAHNPVDWYPWGADALAKAKRENKPIFLSIGYSTCYWCHVMEQESFENPEIAQELNTHFVSIKVDREERPDLDATYMSAVMALSGQGGWPMTVFLTPDGKPFWGGTYFPPEDRGGRPGMKSILPSIAGAWQAKRETLVASSESITHALKPHAPPEAASLLTPELLRDAAGQFASQYDDAHGGFGPAPKFPRTPVLSFLLRRWTRTHDPKTLTMAEATLEAMARGGIHDQLGGGFHRYSTDQQWLVPHFEKMLYDQALVARAYLEAYQATGKPAYAEVARDVFEYVLRDLRDPEGAFYSAEDAGEVGKEGAFYLWTRQEIKASLGDVGEEELVDWVTGVFGVTPEGHVDGRSVLHLTLPLEAIVDQPEGSVGEIRASARWMETRKRLFAARCKRPRPHRDDKILADWNGLMIGALAYGGRVLGEPRYTEAARQAAAFILARMQQDGRLLHRYRDGEAKIEGFLDDYAFFAWGLLDLYEATFDAAWLQQARRLAETMVGSFWDEPAGGLLLTGANHETLIASTKELYDGALPSGNSVAALVLVRLGQLTTDAKFEQHAQRLFAAFSGQLTQAAHAFPQCLIALDAWLGPSQEIVIAGDASQPATQAIVRLIATRFLPRAVVLLHEPGEAGRAIEAFAPFVKHQQPMNGQPTVYVCQQHVCQLPTTDLARLSALLDALQ